VVILYSQRIDPLADVLELSRVRGTVIANVRAHAPWGLALPQTEGAAFHAFTSGTAWLRMDGREPVQLLPGDVLLFPTGRPHLLSSEPDAPCRPFNSALKERLITPEGDLTIPGPGPAMSFVCAAYEYDLEGTQPLMSQLPEMLYVPADPVAGRDIAAIVELLALEVGARNAGSRTAAARLIEVLLIAAIRRWAAERRAGADCTPSWLMALGDPTIARVLALLHERPADPWTVQALADEVHLSRATLARRFADAVGEPPLAYLARWRMHLASHRLKHTPDTVETIAHDVGYTSEYAFNRAFARHRGQPPGRYRRLARVAA
jgi:AraC-like DNA-binding protein